MKTLFINRSPTRELLSVVAADTLVAIMGEVIAERGVCRLALAGGSTPRGVYQRWARHHKESIDWSKVALFFGDERCVPPDDDASNFKMAKQTLLDHVPVGTVHRIRGEEEPEAAIAHYTSVLQRAGFLDIVLLGMGGDGHTASLFPDTPDLMTDALVVRTRSPAPPADRISLSLRVLNSAHRVFFLVSGASKAERLAEVYFQAVSGGARTLPAAMVAPYSGDLIWLVDSAAAAALPAGAPDVSR